MDSGLLGSPVRLTMIRPGRPGNSKAMLMAARIPTTTGSFTVIVPSSAVFTRPSSAVSRSTYVPPDETVTVVVAECSSANSTDPGPLNWLQLNMARPGGFGFPSLVTDPFMEIGVPVVTVWAGPASTTGAQRAEEP